MNLIKSLIAKLFPRDLNTACQHLNVEPVYNQESGDLLGFDCTDCGRQDVLPQPCDHTEYHIGCPNCSLELQDKIKADYDAMQAKWGVEPKYDYAVSDEDILVPDPGCCPTCNVKLASDGPLTMRCPNCNSLWLNSYLALLNDMRLVVLPTVTDRSCKHEHTDGDGIMKWCEDCDELLEDDTEQCNHPTIDEIDARCAVCKDNCPANCAACIG
jgi:hypothetical protein